MVLEAASMSCGSRRRRERPHCTSSQAVRDPPEATDSIITILLLHIITRFFSFSSFAVYVEGVGAVRTSGQQRMLPEISIPIRKGSEGEFPPSLCPFSTASGLHLQKVKFSVLQTGTVSDNIITCTEAIENVMITNL